MLCDTVDIDEKLFAAQDDRKLVVFAGAGVSMGAPSELPSFPELVKRMADGPLEPFGYPKRNLDYVLGQMKFKGIDVHEQCRRIIANPLSRPNALHSAILGLFPNPLDIRVITTNFDPHFLNCPAAQGKDIPVFYGPALPLGHDFRGIVHLHGTILDPIRMILTDENFGSAYMTDGWVARFLREVFATYTVIFIGYSHDDPTMNYFNLGLGGRRRQHFILTYADLPEWERLHLTPLLYEKVDHDHSKLTTAVEAWARESSMRPSEVDARLQQILSKPPAGVQYEEDFIRRHYCRRQSVASFIEHAQLFEWIPWMHNEGLIRPILLEFRGRGADETEEEYQAQRSTHGNLAFWLGRNLAKNASGTGFSIVEECGGTLNFNSARGILIELINTWEKAAMTDTAFPTLAQKRWLYLLLRQSPTTYLGLYSRAVDLLGRHGQWSAALRVIAHLVSSLIREPRPNDIDGIFGRSPAPAVIGEHYDLTQALEAINSQAAQQPQRQAELLAVLELACMDLGELFEILGRNNHHQPDLVPFVSILSQTEVDSDSDSIRLLVRSTCLVALDLARAGRLKKEDFIRWLDSRNQILIRCALLCMRHSPLAPSDVLDVLIHHNGIYPLAFRANIERAELVNAVYPQWTEAEKQAYWSAINAGPSAEWEKGALNEQS